MLRVVLDTNVFISSFFGGPPKEIINLWKNGHICLCLSQDIVEEYLKILYRLGLKDKKELQELTWLFAQGRNVLFTTKTPKINIIENDPEDNKFLECALALESKIVISGDKHLKEIKKYLDIQIMSPRKFLEFYNA
jgi:putative PIN family toxin of toxin-antitoxin system